MIVLTDRGRPLITDEASLPLIVPAPSAATSHLNTACIESGQPRHLRAAEFVIDLSRTADLSSLTVERTVLGHSVYSTILRDVVVFGHHHLHGFITERDLFRCQEVENAERLLDYHVSHHPGRELPMPQIVRLGSGFMVDYRRIADQVVTEVEGRVLFGTPTEPLNWGMWLLQAVPIVSRFIEQRTSDTLLINAEQPWQRGLLASLGVADDQITPQILGQTYYCNNLELIQYTSVDLLPTPSDCRLYSKLRETVTGTNTRRPWRKIFISRQSVSTSNGGYRALLNEEELILEIKKLGFEIYEPEKLSFSDQILLFAEASLVVGLGGAALFNTVFCLPNTMIVTIESSATFVFGHAAMFSSLGHRYGVIIGTQDYSDPTPIHKRWLIDVPAVLRALSVCPAGF